MSTKSSRSFKSKPMQLDNEAKRRKTDSGLDLDELLSLEEQYYRDGYKEGQEMSTKAQYNEGKEYGYQTGFQRFLVVGYLRGLASYWSQNLEKYEAKAVAGHLAQLQEILDSINVSNDDISVASYEKNINKARNKVRVVAGLCKEQWKISKLDDLVKEVGGSLQVSENVDDMW